jgi:hypothetical protein
MSSKDIVAAFVACLDNDDVINQLGAALSVLINLALHEKLALLLKKFHAAAYGIRVESDTVNVTAVNRGNGNK